MLALLLAGIEVTRYYSYEWCVRDIRYSQWEQGEEKYLREHPDMKIPLDPIKRTVQQEMELVDKIGVSEWLAGAAAATKACAPHYRFDVFQWFSSLTPVSVANAQVPSNKDEADNQIRRTVILMIFGCTAAFFIASTGALFFPKMRRWSLSQWTA
jgi:hypothetical protein